MVTAIDISLLYCMFRPFLSCFHVSLCCTCLYSHFGIPMRLLDHYSIIPVTPVCLGTMALPPLVGSAHSHRSLG